MSGNKTKITDQPVQKYLQTITDTVKRKDIEEVIELVNNVTQLEPCMWGTSIVGFGNIHYKYESGREGDTPMIGVSARKQAITIYGLIFYDEQIENSKLLESLGTYKTGKGCLYIKKLTDIDLSVLRQMIQNTYASKTK